MWTLGHWNACTDTVRVMWSHCTSFLLVVWSSIYVHMYVCTYTYIHTYVYTCVCMHMYVCMYIYIHTYFYTCVCMHMYVCTYTNYDAGYWRLICVAIAPAYVPAYVCVSYNCPHTITKQQHGAVFVVWTSDMIFPPYCCHNTQLPYTRNPWQARNIICISQSHASRWYDMYVRNVRNYIVTSRVFAYSFDSGPLTAHRQLCLHDGSLNGSPWLVPLCVRPFLHNVHTTTCPESRIRHL